MDTILEILLPWPQSFWVINDSSSLVIFNVYKVLSFRLSCCLPFPLALCKRTRSLTSLCFCCPPPPPFLSCCAKDIVTDITALPLSPLLSHTVQKDIVINITVLLLPPPPPFPSCTMQKDNVIDTTVIPLFALPSRTVQKDIVIDITVLPLSPFPLAQCKRTLTLTPLCFSVPLPLPSRTV